MDIYRDTPIIFWVITLLLLGLGIGSFLNVLIARLPEQKTPFWPGSRCFHCLQSIALLDNLPILGYLRLRGRCRHCGVSFSSRYLWVELATGLGFVALFFLEIKYNIHRIPAFASGFGDFESGLPTWRAIPYYFSHVLLFSLLLTSALIDLKHRFIPAEITYLGTFFGILMATIFPWPFPTVDPNILAAIPNDRSWILPEVYAAVPKGMMLLPFWGPLPDWAAPGTHQLGFLTAVIGALVGLFIGRAIKFLFEIGMGQAALGLGDADLLMMAGAFLGWQVIAPAFFVGAVVTLIFVIPLMLLAFLRKQPFNSQVPFGPGIAAGVMLCWLGWPWVGPMTQAIFFDFFILGFIIFVMGGGMMIAGLLLRRKPAAPARG